uniref:Cystatin-B n=1 Tax=Monopterus albus TaxID=43700 RepID=A0A3Q3KMI8_MONAL|nr:cystatin-B-like [Monopterus albus]
MSNLLGAYSETIPIDEIRKICDQVKCQVQEKTKKVYQEFRAVAYRYQIVAGRNYLIKVCVGNNYLHLWVYEHLPCDGGDIELQGVEECHSKEDPIEPF